MEHTEEARNWAIYHDAATELADIADEGPEPTGASGSNWQYGYTRQAAEAFLAEHLAKGYRQGHNRNPRV